MIMLLILVIQVEACKLTQHVQKVIHNRGLNLKVNKIFSDSGIHKTDHTACNTSMHNVICRSVATLNS